MKVEVLVDSQEPIFYPLNKKELTLGSHPSSDIQVNATCVSRRHLIISLRDDKIFITDQGSTNGTFLNEQRLIPGRAMEFTSFFPVRLGSEVLLTLHSDADDDIEPEQDHQAEQPPKPITSEQTRHISLAELARANTASLEKKRQDRIQSKLKADKQTKGQAKNKNAKKNLVWMPYLALFALAAYYQLFWSKGGKLTPAPVAVKTSPVPAPAAKTPWIPQRVAESEIPDQEALTTLAQQRKCAEGKERELCIVLRKVFVGSWGVVGFGKHLVIFTDGQKYLRQAQELLNQAPGHITGELNAEQIFSSNLNLVMTLLWIRENVPAELVSLETFKEYHLTIAFMTASPAPGSFMAGAIFVPEALLRLRDELKQEHFENSKKEGPAAFAYAFEYPRLF